MEGEIVSRKKNTHRFRLILLGFILLLSVYLFLHSSIFNLTQIEVIGNDKVTSEEVIALSGLAPGMNIFGIDEVIVAKSIEVHPLVKSAVIERKPPHTVMINLTERQIWAIIPYNDIFLCIDDVGVCFDKLNYTPIDNDLIITLDLLPERVVLGQAVSPQAIEMIKQVWQALPASEQQMISDIHYQSQDAAIKIYTIKGTEVRFGNIERFDEKVKTFAQVIQMENDLEQQGTDKLEYVDIRYKGEPVVKTRS